MACVSVGCQGTGIPVTLDHMSSRSLAEVVGANCRRIRTEIGITQDELALYARAHGLKWNAAKAGDFEAGRSEPTLATVIKVGMALGQALAFTQSVAPAFKDRGVIPRDREVRLADLLDGGNEVISLTDNLAITTADLANVARGEPFPLRLRRHDADKLQRSGLAEQRLAKALSIGESRLAELSSQLWRNTFSEERDRRAGIGADQQKKARVSRELRSEIEKALTGGHNQ